MTYVDAKKARLSAVTSASVKLKMVFGQHSSPITLKSGLNSSGLSGDARTNGGNNRESVKMSSGSNGHSQQLNVIKAIDSYSVSYRCIQTTEQT
jgi:hypothetical protein